MKGKIKIILSIVFCLIINNGIWADVVVDGLKYSLNGTVATVIGYTNIAQNLVIPETITYMGTTYKVQEIGRGSSPRDGVFYNNKTLRSVRFKGEIIIGNHAFYECTALRYIVFEKTPDIGSEAFCSCSSLTYLVLPNGTHVGWRTFEECNMIQNVILLGSISGGDIYGHGNGDLGLSSNVNYYHRDDFITWSNNSYNYTGKSRNTPTFTNNLPNGFKPTNYESVTLEVNAGNYLEYIPFTFANNDMSFDVKIPYYYTINPIVLKARILNVTREYGEANPSFESQYSGFVNGEDASVITSHGHYTTNATQNSDVGVYTITQSDAQAQNYTFSYESGKLTVTKAQLTMIANDKRMDYGDSVPLLDATYEGLKNNESQPKWITEPQIITSATSTSDIGTYPIIIRNADPMNYNIAYKDGVLSIEKAELTMRVNNASRLYGDENPQFTVSYIGLKNGENEPAWTNAPSIATEATKNSSVGNYPIKITKVGLAKNYNVTGINGTLTVNKASLKITPKDVTRKYGEDNPTFELSYDGLKNNEIEPEWIIAPIIKTNATKTSNVGEYKIDVTSAEAKNYDIEKLTGKLYITKAQLDVFVENSTKKYGDYNPQFKLRYEGLMGDEQEPTWLSQPTFKTTATKMSDVGKYVVSAEGGEMKNYETAGIISGELNITPASLRVKAKDVNRLYYEENPTFSSEFSGFVNGDNESALSCQPTFTTIASIGSPVGNYPIEVGGAVAKNYNVEYENDMLTINKRSLHVSTKNYSKAYNEENPTFELLYDGFVNNEDENVLIVKPKATTIAKKDTDVGTYIIVISGGVAENYDFTYTNGLLTIDKAYQTLIWDQDLINAKIYDQIELTATASSGLEVSYFSNDPSVCAVTKIGNKYFLDCLAEGETAVYAIQEGNNNYWQTTKVYQRVRITDLMGINHATFSDKEVNVYGINGTKHKSLRKGVNILKMSNGTTRKVVVK